MDAPGPDPLHVAVDAGDGPTVVLLHGFTQTGISWRPVVERLRHRTVRVDLPGHGGSGDIEADLSTTAALVAAAIARHGGPDGAPVLVGYSMGGRVALRLAIDRPTALSGLVLLGATAGLDDPTERAERRRGDEALAADIERDGVDAFVTRWLAQPLFAGLRTEQDDLAARRANPPAGLAGSLRRAGTGTMDPPWWDELSAVSVPTLVCWGERDERFAALGQRLAEGIGPLATSVELPRVGHAAHLEDPVEFAAELERFVDQIRGGSTGPR